jgi:hypothetical protein
MAPQGIYVGIRFLEETLAWAQTFTTEGLSKQVEEIAVLTCNNNGIYE